MGEFTLVISRMHEAGERNNVGDFEVDERTGETTVFRRRAASAD